MCGAAPVLPAALSAEQCSDLLDRRRGKCPVGHRAASDEVEPGDTGSDTGHTRDVHLLRMTIRNLRLRLDAAAPGSTYVTTGTGSATASPDRSRRGRRARARDRRHELAGLRSALRSSVGSKSATSGSARAGTAWTDDPLSQAMCCRTLPRTVVSGTLVVDCGPHKDCGDEEWLERI